MDKIVLDEGSLMYRVVKLYKDKILLGIGEISEVKDGYDISIYDVISNETRISIVKLKGGDAL